MFGDHMNFKSKKRVGLFLTVAIFVSGCAVDDTPEDVAIRESLKGIAITEINYNPLPLGKIDGDEFEFIEIKNISSSKVSLNNVAFDTGVDFTFPAGSAIDPGEMIVLASNSKEFAGKYGFDPFGVYTGKLSNSGEKISMRDLDAGEEFLSIEYGDQNPWPSLADGEGRSLVLVDNENNSSLSSASSWRSSFMPGGSPGKDDPNVVYVNEVLTRTDPPLKDAIELYNPNNVSIDLGGWYLTDKKSEPAKYKIPAGTLIPAKGYKVFYSSEFNNSDSPTAFKLSAHGEGVYLSSDSTGYTNGYAHGFSYGEIEDGVSFGRYLTSTGEEHFVAQKSLTLEKENSGPLVGPVVISEIMYNPQNGIDEFIELYNISSSEVPLYDTQNPQNSWKIDEVMSFPADTKIGAGEKILVLSNAATISEFRTLYGVPENVQIFSTTVNLANSGGTLTLSKPEKPFTDNTADTITNVVPYMVFDKVTYKDAGQWPKEADGLGMSLQRIVNSEYGNDPANWKAGEPSPGK
jgi:hypothetical protein